MRNKVLLIRPPTIMKGTSFIATQFPLNLASIAAGLKKKDCEVRIWDFDVKDLHEDDFVKSLREFSPSTAGISCYTPTVINGHRIASLIKKHYPDVITVVGGPHVSALPKETMEEFPSFDIGVVGEGEETMIELADKLSQGLGIADINGICYRDEEGTLRQNTRRKPIRDLDSIPFPARELLDFSLYKGQSHRGFSRGFLKITEIMTSRGCPNRCIFCASDVVMEGTVRFRGADSVKEEIAECINKYGFNHFTISDDTFTLKEERLYEICEEFARKKISWNCNARVWPISRKMLSVMVESGCSGITFGVESGSPRILKLIKKNISIEQVENAFRLAREAGVKLIEADIIIGSHPLESKEDVAMTKRLLNKISPDIIMASVVVPYPGTELCNIMKRGGLIFDEKKWDSFILFGKEPSWRTYNFSPKQLVSIQKSMLLSFYLRPIYILRILGKAKSLKELMYWIRSGIDFLVSSVKRTSKSKKQGSIT